MFISHSGLIAIEFVSVCFFEDLSCKDKTKEFVIMKYGNVCSGDYGSDCKCVSKYELKSSAGD